MVKKVRKNIYSAVNPVTGQIVATRFQIACAIIDTAYISYHSALPNFCKSKIAKSRRYLINESNERSIYNSEWKLMAPEGLFEITEQGSDILVWLRYYLSRYKSGGTWFFSRYTWASNKTGGYSGVSEYFLIAYFFYSEKKKYNQFKYMK